VGFCHAKQSRKAFQRYTYQTASIPVPNTSCSLRGVANSYKEPNVGSHLSGRSSWIALECSDRFPLDQEPLPELCEFEVDCVYERSVEYIKFAHVAHVLVRMPDRNDPVDIDPVDMYQLDNTRGRVGISRR
jgi:hypothetical protein